VEIVHAVRSDAFAGVERYVAHVANELAARGHRVRVVGGDAARMAQELREDVVRRPAASFADVLRACLAAGRADVVHLHMTAAEAAGVLSWPAHRARLVATRHFPWRRGSSVAVALAGRAIARALSAELAVSRFVADRIDGRSVVLYHGLPGRPQAALTSCRVLMLQRLEADKSPEVGLRAWARSGLAAEGWTLDIAGRGRLEAAVDREARALGVRNSVRLLGRVADTDLLLREASVFLAPGAVDSFGLAVVEAMAHGVPVVAAAGGAHPETVGSEGELFPPGDARAAAAALRRLALSSDRRNDVGRALRARQQRLFALDVHVSRLERVYESVARASSSGVSGGTVAGRPPQRQHLTADVERV
jgi:glycosyltransferase involved in cell wall biosynthesis